MSMAPTGPESAVVVRIPVPRAVDRLRARWDRAATRGVPAHVTIVYPFVPGARLNADVRRELAAIAATHDPFEVEFARIGRFPGVVFADPEPAAAFAALTAAIVARYPDFPPYGGAHDVVIPHLTIAEAQDAPLDAIAEQTAAVLPFQHRVSALDVLVEGGDGRWRRRWRIRLGASR
jgi:2'-5' RNA ligase